MCKLVCIVDVCRYTLMVEEIVFQDKGFLLLHKLRVLIFSEEEILMIMHKICCIFKCGSTIFQSY